MKDVPKLGGPDSLFFRAGLESGYSSRLSLSSSQQYPGAAGQTGQTKVSQSPVLTSFYNKIFLENWEVECNAR